MESSIRDASSKWDGSHWGLREVDAVSKWDGSHWGLREADALSKWDCKEGRLIKNVDVFCYLQLYPISPL